MISLSPRARIRVITLLWILLITLSPCHLVTLSPVRAAEVEQWGMFELTLRGPADGNPFVEVELSATFTHGDKKGQVSGFYDGDGTYCVRFMPEEPGEWSYTTASNRPELNAKTGTLTVGKPSPGNHGPVRV